MTSPRNALVIDDEPAVRSFVADALFSLGWNAETASSAPEAYAAMKHRDFPLVFCDVFLGETDGYEVLRRFVEERPASRIILMTGRGSAAGAFEATSTGAFDYMVKPFTLDDVAAIARTVERQMDESETTADPSAPNDEPEIYSGIPLIGSSPKFVECLKQVGRVAHTDLTVLITGESGTGKEVVAKAIHSRSIRKEKAFIAINCAAIPADLIESELFGHVKGSFSGAVSDRRGLWEEADGGTLFLDEVTETSLKFQVKLLRVLQENEMRRVGSNATIKVDVRVIAASNANIDAEVTNGRFRQDLLYRLNAVTIALPPLRDRKEDIPLLAAHFVKKLSNGAARIGRDATEALKHYDWPGNVRELENVMYHATAICDKIIRPRNLPEKILSLKTVQTLDEGLGNGDDLVSLAAMQSRYAARVLEHTNGNKQAAARILGIDRKTLSRILERLD